MQVQIGMWFLTWHSALMPQVPGHGSIHLFLLQALLEGQSEWTTHSGRHAMYGSPKYSGIHWHEAADLCLLQTAFDPHGDGLHGSITSTLGGTKIMILYWMKRNLQSYKLFSCNRQWRDLQYILDHKHKMGNDCWPNKLHETHKHQDKGLCIYFEHKLIYWDIPG